MLKTYLPDVLKINNTYTVVLSFAASGGGISALIQRFVVQPQDIEVVAGQSAKLQCFVVGQ